MSHAVDPAGLWPHQVADYYGLPADRDARGQRIGIVAMGGGFHPADLAVAAEAAGLPPPDVVVRRNANTPDRDARADEELALDLQVLAGVAVGAQLAVYFAEPRIADLAAAITAVAADAVVRAKVLVICWGSSEDVWPSATVQATEAALAAAAGDGISVVAAAGDQLACAGFPGEAHVLYPASSPQVLACGGTSLILDADNRILGEEVWNEGMNQRGTGGGISRLFDPQPFQAGVALPPSAAGAGPGRGVPDVAALAAVNPGWRIILRGVERTSGGTSAAAPFWGAILALANAQRAQVIGLPHRALYGRPDLFHPITAGDNKVNGIGYDAGPGWNACCGLGSPRADALLAALVAA